MRRLFISLLVTTLVMVTGCDVVDPARPTPQPDAEVFGNLLDVEKLPDDPNSWTIRIQVGAPRSVRAADEDIGKPTPEVEKGTVATVSVGADAVVYVDDRPGLLEEIASGTEIVVLPVAGTTRMFGSNDLRVEANTVMDFATYRRWRLPKLESTGDTDGDDPTVINTTGSELAPVPVADGKVLYFAAHLRPPVSAEDSWQGAFRDGFVEPGEGVSVVERSYRSELTTDGWTAPELVAFADLEEAIQTRVTWVSDDETVCLVTVRYRDQPSWVGQATRRNARADWSAPQRLETLGDDARDAVYLTGSRTKIVFSTNRGGGTHSDLFLYDPKIEQGPGALQPPVYSNSNEWNPRTGPVGELLFGRDDRQLILQGGQVRPLRLTGPHRVPISRAAISGDGRWLFFCLPKFRTPEMDEDIYVANVMEDYELGQPVSVDEWRP
jgi:hypothetical protein